MKDIRNNINMKREVPQFDKKLEIAEKFDRIAEKIAFNVVERKHFDDLVKELLAIANGRTWDEIKANNANIKVARKYIQKLKDLKKFIEKKGYDPEVVFEDFHRCENMIGNGRNFIVTVKLLNDAMSDLKVVNDEGSQVENIFHSITTDFISSTRDDGGITLVACNTVGSKVLIDEKGQEISGEYESIIFLQEGKKLYKAELLPGDVDNNDKQFVVLNNEGYEVSDYYRKIENLFFTDNRYYLVVRDNDNVRKVVDQNGVTLLNNYEGTVVRVDEFDGKAYFTTKRARGDFAIFKESKQDHHRPLIDSCFDIIDVYEESGVLVAIIFESKDADPRWKKCYLENGKFSKASMPMEVADISHDNIIESGNDRFYIANDSTGMEFIIDSMGIRVSDYYENIIRAIKTENSLRIIERNSDGKFKVCTPDDKTIGANYEAVGKIYNFEGDEIYYIAEKNGKMFLHDSDGVPITPPCTAIKDVFMDGGKVFYICKTVEGPWMLLSEGDDNRAFNFIYDSSAEIDSYELNGKFYFTRTKPNQYLIDNKGRRVSDDYKKIIDVMTKDDGCYVVAIDRDDQVVKQKLVI